jgi:hypothetical protein
VIVCQPKIHHISRDCPPSGARLGDGVEAEMGVNKCEIYRSSSPGRFVGSDGGNVLHRSRNSGAWLDMTKRLSPFNFQFNLV